MSNPDPQTTENVLQWVSYAEEDIKLAAHALTLGRGTPYRLVAYHAQQCAEKYLKAFLVCKNEDFPYTHNITRLLRLCAKHAAWAESLKDAEELTPYAITARYPGEDEEVTQEEAQEAVEIAQRVREEVRKALTKLRIVLPE
jgi:HEPN domain-containing protein